MWFCAVWASLTEFDLARVITKYSKEVTPLSVQHLYSMLPTIAYAKAYIHAATIAYAKVISCCHPKGFQLQALHVAIIIVCCHPYHLQMQALLAATHCSCQWYCMLPTKGLHAVLSFLRGHYNGKFLLALMGVLARVGF